MKRMLLITQQYEMLHLALTSNEQAHGSFELFKNENNAPSYGGTTVATSQPVKL